MSIQNLQEIVTGVHTYEDPVVACRMRRRMPRTPAATGWSQSHAAVALWPPLIRPSPPWPHGPVGSTGGGTAGVGGMAGIALVWSTDKNLGRWSGKKIERAIEREMRSFFI
jgi:hypothetical protein